MSSVNRTVIAFAAILPLAGVAVVIGNTLGLGSWGFTGLALVALLLVTLLDREGFYGTPRGRRTPHSPPPASRWGDE
jgi:hypothetical protein